MLGGREIQMVRRYLLGTLNDEDEIRHIEERIMLEDDFESLVAATEDELIERYLDGELDGPDREAFLQHFLAAPERKNDLRMVRMLREVASRQKLAPLAASSSRGIISTLQTLFLRRWVVAGVGGLVICALAAGLWRGIVYQSDTDKGLVQLRSAYRGGRPFQSRVTSFPDHSAYTETRGKGPIPADPAALERAHRYLVDASSDPTDWRAHHAFGLYHFAGGDLDRARREFEIAVSRRPADPGLLADIGALFIESAKREFSRGREDLAIEHLNESLKSLNEAIALGPSLPEPRFNRALGLELLKDVEQAKEAWRDYLTLDPDSPWAQEARAHLRRLEENHPPQRSASELETDLLDAHRLADRDRARSILRANRELIRETYIPVRLAASLVHAAPERRAELLSALTFAAELEIDSTGDPFAGSIAAYYTAVPGKTLESLKLYQNEMAAGYGLCRAHDYESAVVKFRAAKGGFDRFGNPSEAAVAQYLLGYALVNSGRSAEGQRQLAEVSAFARSRGYAWLEATALYWIGGSHVKSKDHHRAKEEFKKALAIAERIDDPYSTQRNALELSNLFSYSGQGGPALKHLYRALSLSSEPGTSHRQRYRTLVDAFVTLSRLKLFDAALPKVLEAVALSDRIGDDFWRSQSRNFAGVGHAQLDNIAAARAWLTEGAEFAAAVKGRAAAETLAGFSNLKLGDVERAAGNHEHAEHHYREAIAFFDRTDMPASKEEAHKGLLLTLLSSGRGGDLEGEIARNIEFVESYRATMRDDDDRLSFLASRGNVYDVATDFEFRRGDAHRAFEYAEMSSARSLQDRLHGEDAGAPNTGGASPGGRRPRRAAGVPLADVQRDLPARVQVIRYAVLDDRVLVWVIDSSGGLHADEIPIPASSLGGKVASFRRAITDVRSLDDPRLHGAGRELYDLLIGPIRNVLDPRNEICIVPSGELFRLPFAALIDPGGQVLAAEFDLLYSPSTRTFLSATASARGKSQVTDESVLSIGDPSFDRGRFDYLSYLPAAESEARAVSRLYPRSKTLLGPDASEVAFLEDLPGAEVIHFAGHYVPVHGAPGSSFLLLAGAAGGGSGDGGDGTLTNLELARRKLPRARLLVLSACQSGPEVVYPGEGMMGISRTVLAAGVPLVVGSQWAVDSPASAKLMTLFHHFRKREGLTTTKSLRKAQLALANDPEGGYSAPYYWAAFSVYGGKADF